MHVTPASPRRSYKMVVNLKPVAMSFHRSGRHTRFTIMYLHPHRYQCNASAHHLAGWDGPCHVGYREPVASHLRRELEIPIGAPGSTQGRRSRPSLDTSPLTEDLDGLVVLRCCGPRALPSRNRRVSPDSFTIYL